MNTAEEVKIASQEALIAAMSPNDPLLHDALINLHEMRHNGIYADLSRSLVSYDERKEV